MTTKHPREHATANSLRIDQLTTALAAAETRQAQGVSAEERAHAAQEVRDLRYELDVRRTYATQLRSEVPENVSPKKLERRLKELDTEREKLTKAERPDPMAIGEHDERTRAERETIAARLATAPAAAPTPNPDHVAAVAKAKAEFRELSSRNPVAAAMYADRHPEVHEPETTP